VAQYDSADLLARCKTLAQRPTTDEDMSDATWYGFLEEAQTYWIGQLAAHVPEVMYDAPELMTSSDGGETYTVASYPLGHMEIRASRNGALLRPGPEWDEAADYTQEGQTIRIPGGRTRSFSSGPYARYVKVPGLLNGATAPVLRPAHMRLLLVARACYLYALRGGYRDPTPFLQLEQKLWAGDPNLAGDTGYLGQLKTQYFGAGMAAVRPLDDAWWRGSPDLG
jgi:hypothetical protein